MRDRGGIEVQPLAAALGPGDSTLGIDLDVPHVPEVDHQRAIGDGVAGHAVATAAHRDRKTRSACAPDRRDHVVR